MAQSKECSKCGVGKPYKDFCTSKRNKSGIRAHCKECEAANKKKYYLENKQEIRDRNDQWKKDNKEKHNKNFRKWRKSNLDVMAAHCALNRAKRGHRLVSWANKAYIADLYRNAKEASAVFNIEYEVDHIIPLLGEKVSGLHVESNLQIIPKTLNRSKGNKYTI